MGTWRSQKLLKIRGQLKSRAWHRCSGLAAGRKAFGSARLHWTFAWLKMGALPERIATAVSEANERCSGVISCAARGFPQTADSRRAMASRAGCINHSKF